MKDLKGIFSALLVAYNSDGSINEKGLRQIIRHNIDKMQVDGLYVGGSTGGNFMLSTEEKKQIFQIAKDEAGDSIDLIAQIGSVNIKEAIELGQYATKLGYDCLSAVTPFYYNFGFAEIKNYYNTIVSETANDMILYSIPYLTGVNTTVEQFGELYENDKIIGVKISGLDMLLVERLKNAFPNKRMWAGADELLVVASMFGAEGAIGSTFNVNALKARQIMNLIQKENKVKEAVALQHQYNNFIEALLNSKGLFLVLQEILKLQGVEAGTTREPLNNKPSAEQLALAKELFEKFVK